MPRGLPHCKDPDDTEYTSYSIFHPSHHEMVSYMVKTVPRGKKEDHKFLYK
jgi:hypothetical protein